MSGDRVDLERLTSQIADAELPPSAVPPAARQHGDHRQGLELT